MAKRLCACGKETVPVKVGEFTYLGKVVKNVPAFKCIDPGCPYKVTYDSTTLDEVEKLVEQGLSDYKGGPEVNISYV